LGAVCVDDFVELLTWRVQAGGGEKESGMTVFSRRAARYGVVFESLIF